jgi:single-strand DNA-binding protein
MLPTLQTVALIQSKDTRQTQSGKQVTSLRLSVGEKNKNGEYDNFYFDATFWEKASEFVDQYFNEGDLIEVKGDLITTSYDKNGTKVYRTEVKFPKASFPAKPKNSQNNVPQNEAPRQAEQQPQQAQIPEIDVSSEEIPF